MGGGAIGRGTGREGRGKNGRKLGCKKKVNIGGMW